GHAKLRVADEDHARGPPVVDDIGEEVAVHEQRVGLTDKERAPLAIDMPDPHRGLASIDAHAKEVELELRFPGLPGDLTLGKRAKAGWADMEDGLSVAAELALGRWNARWPQRGVPIRVYPIEVLDHVDLGKTVEFERSIAAVVLLRGRGSGIGCLRSCNRG